jgi:hypothetical protein
MRNSGQEEREVNEVTLHLGTLEQVIDKLAREETLEGSDATPATLSRSYITGQIKIEYNG